MSTDLFGVRVLGVDLARREVELRVFVVYYDFASRTYLSPPERDPGFFLGLLWRSGRRDAPIGMAITVDQILERPWVAENARWFVDHVERTAVENDPPPDEIWARPKDFPHAHAGCWADEDLLVQADYVVRVTDPAWIRHLEPGMDWGDAYYPMDADNPRAEDLPRLPYVHRPIVLEPFESETNSMVFSDDGRFLAAFGYDGELVVYDCSGWSEHSRIEVRAGRITWRMAWVPGQHIIVFTELDTRQLRQEAYDVHTGDAVDVHLELGHGRSRTGRHRIEFGNRPGVGFLVRGGDAVQVPGIEEIAIESVAFTGDESRLFAGGMTSDVFVIDAASASVVGTIPDVAPRVGVVAVSPGGDYLVTAGEPGSNPRLERGEEICVRRGSDGEIVIHHWPGALVGGLAWSPDDRWLAVCLEHRRGGGELRIMPIGMPTRPAAAWHPTVPEPRVETDHG
ncbi:WD40 repeat domain-containing protein [Amycolatopsis sp. lyj-112]|uniref:WD40 repeat domain-containing protein n=1 Tax=Amycolatopsis sp. lyj-112 TaxID=2789288 RepID=UPI0039783181